MKASVGESHAGALRLRRQKCLEHLVRVACRQSHTGIVDRDQHFPIVSQFRFDRKFAGRLFHRLNPIEHEIHKYLLQLHAVRHDLGKVGKIGTHGKRVPLGFVAQQHEHFVGNFVHIDRLPSNWRTFLIE